MKFDSGQVDVRKRARLPHWDVQHGIYFVTFNLADAVPAAVRLRIQEEANAQVEHIRFLRGDLTIAEKRAIDASTRAQIVDALDDSYGSCFMREPRVAKIVADAISFFDEHRYLLYAWCVMPNHVHVVLSLALHEKLDFVLHSWKSFTSKAANHALGRQGEFWQKGYYDRTVRDSRDLRTTVDYVLANPSKAGLGAWEFVRSYPDRLGQLESSEMPR
jgi:REP element-mobilizing transposase RayT